MGDLDTRRSVAIRPSAKQLFPLLFVKQADEDREQKEKTDFERPNVEKQKHGRGLFIICCHFYFLDEVTVEQF